MANPPSNKFVTEIPDRRNFFLPVDAYLQLPVEGNPSPPQTTPLVVYIRRRPCCRYEREQAFAGRTWPGFTEKTDDVEIASSERPKKFTADER
jgi:hypothetical protein